MINSKTLRIVLRLLLFVVLIVPIYYTGGQVQSFEYKMGHGMAVLFVYICYRVVCDIIAEQGER